MSRLAALARYAADRSAVLVRTDDVDKVVMASLANGKFGVAVN